jgi:hypothetical protein
MPGEVVKRHADFETVHTLHGSQALREGLDGVEVFFVVIQRCWWEEALDFIVEEFDEDFIVRGGVDLSGGEHGWILAGVSWWD